MTLVAAVVLSMLRGRVFNVASALVFGLGFCAYVQALFMNASNDFILSLKNILINLFITSPFTINL